MLTQILRIGALSLIIWSGTANAQQIDPHAIYEKDCAGCHTPHAGEFASERLSLLDDILVIKETGQPVSVFLETGHGGLSPEEQETLLEFFGKIQQSGRLFFRKCGICHISAKQLARIHLIIRDDKLAGRYTGRDIPQFLLEHGRLEPNEVEIMLGVLERQLLTVPSPQN